VLPSRVHIYWLGRKSVILGNCLEVPSHGLSIDEILYRLVLTRLVLNWLVDMVGQGPSPDKNWLSDNLAFAELVPGVVLDINHHFVGGCDDSAIDGGRHIGYSH